MFAPSWDNLFEGYLKHLRNDTITLRSNAYALDDSVDGGLELIQLTLSIVVV